MPSRNSGPTSLTVSARIRLRTRWPILQRERLRHLAAVRDPEHVGIRDRQLVEERREIVGVLRHRVRARRVVRESLAAAVVLQHAVRRREGGRLGKPAARGVHEDPVVQDQDRRAGGPVQLVVDRDAVDVNRCHDRYGESAPAPVAGLAARALIATKWPVSVRLGRLPSRSMRSTQRSNHGGASARASRRSSQRQKGNQDHARRVHDCAACLDREPSRDEKSLQAPEAACRAHHVGHEPDPVPERGAQVPEPDQTGSGDCPSSAARSRPDAGPGGVSQSAAWMSDSRSKWSSVESDRTPSNTPEGNGSRRTSAATAAIDACRAAAPAAVDRARSQPSTRLPRRSNHCRQAVADGLVEQVGLQDAPALEIGGHAIEPPDVNRVAAPAPECDPGARPATGGRRRPSTRGAGDAGFTRRGSPGGD